MLFAFSEGRLGCAEGRCMIANQRLLPPTRERHLPTLERAEVKVMGISKPIPAQASAFVGLRATLGVVLERSRS
jgi:hypothetical protein